MAKVVTRPGSIPLDGEDLRTEHWEDARHWLSIYADLLRFKRGILDRVARELRGLPIDAQKAAAADLAIIEDQMEGYLERIDLWYQRLWDLQGLWIDPHDRVIRHGGNEARLTGREQQLLGFLLAHPHRFFTAEQITTHAWSDSALLPDEVRNYIQRVRRILRRLQAPVELVNRPGRGYSLVFSG
ncbi:MAG: Transcriptional regulatory protein terminal [Chloroflexota bacterium]|nr:Transcriptional regulatory protein terminal [Chloroflexota bacterium]